MGLFDAFKKNREPEQVREAGLLFCPEPDPRKVLNRVEELLQLEHTGDSNLLTLHKGDLEINLLAACPGDQGEMGKYAKDQLSGAAGYVYQVETALTDIKRNLFYQMRQCNSLVKIAFSFKSAGPAETARKEKQAQELLLEITAMLGGVVTFGDGLTFLDGQGQVILDKGGKSGLKYYMPTEIQPGAEWAEGAPAEAMERRNRSLALLRERHIHVTPWLPLLDEAGQVPGRTVGEVCGRAAALLVVSLYSECRLGEHMSYEESRKFIAPVMESYGAERFLSPGEKAYLEDPDSTEQTQVQYCWQYENLWVMEWALGLTEDLFWPDHICDVPGTARIMRERDTMEALLAAAKLRPRSELLDQADLIYRLRWACEDARVMGMPAPQGVDSGVVMERHRALFWLAGIDNMCGWDEVDLST